MEDVETMIPAPAEINCRLVHVPDLGLPAANELFDELDFMGILIRDSVQD